jgi:hypothetical protein
VAQRREMRGFFAALRMTSFIGNRERYDYLL